MAEKWILAIDIGSSSARVNLYDRQGNQQFSLSKPTGFAQQGRPVGEVDAEALWNTVLGLLQESGKHVELSTVQGMGVTAQLGMVLLDADGKPIGPCLTWSDRRAVEEAAELKTRIGEKIIYQATGKKIDPESVAAKLLWLQKNQKERMSKVKSVVSLKDYIIKQLSDTLATDPIHASYSLLSCLDTGTWNDPFIRELDLVPDWFPEIKKMTEYAFLSDSIASMTGLKPGIPVAIGGPDGSVGAFGAGLYERGTAVNVMGTTDVFFTVSDQRIEDPMMRVVVHPHILPGKWFVGGPMAATGGVLAQVAQWLNVEDLSSLTLNEGYVPGSNDLVFLTSFTGERFPHWNPSMKGSLIGMTMEHQPSHILQALMEGISYPVRQSVDILKELNLDISEIIAVGGGARNASWIKMRASIVGIDYVTHEIVESSSWGTAVIAGIASGMFDPLSLPKSALAQRYTPHTEKVKAYDRLYQNYKRLHEVLKTYYFQLID